MYAYEFSRKRITFIASTFVVLWVLDFALRVVLYVYFGHDFYISNWNRILSAVSGVFAGCAITLWVIRSKSLKLKVPDEAVAPE